MKLARTYVSIPWAYDAMKHLYIGKTTNCGMMVGVDIFSQCPDSDRTNNFAVFPVRLLVNETKGNITLIYIVVYKIKLYILKMIYFVHVSKLRLYHL